MKQEVEHISIYIHHSPDEVYAFAANPENLPRWAAGLASSALKPEGDWWLADAPFAQVRIQFAEANSFGVMDHDVKLDSGIVVRNFMRVIANNEGSEFIFTLLRQAGMSDKEFAKDRQAVAADLASLKALLEN